MSSTLIPEKTDVGWVVEIPTEIARAMGIEDGSVAVLHPGTSRLEVEILPPPSRELDQSVRRIYEKYKDAFAEMKRLGD